MYGNMHGSDKWPPFGWLQTCYARSRLPYLPHRCNKSNAGVRMQRTTLAKAYRMQADCREPLHSNKRSIRRQGDPWSSTGGNRYHAYRLQTRILHQAHGRSICTVRLARTCEPSPQCRRLYHTLRPTYATVTYAPAVPVLQLRACSLPFQVWTLQLPCGTEAAKPRHPRSGSSTYGPRRPSSRPSSSHHGSHITPRPLPPPTQTPPPLHGPAAAAAVRPPTLPPPPPRAPPHPG